MVNRKWIWTCIIQQRWSNYGSKHSTVKKFRLKEFQLSFTSIWLSMTLDSQMIGYDWRLEDGHDWVIGKERTRPRLFVFRQRLLYLTKCPNCVQIKHEWNIQYNVNNLKYTYNQIQYFYGQWEYLYIIITNNFEICTQITIVKSFINVVYWIYWNNNCF